MKLSVPNLQGLRLPVLAFCVGMILIAHHGWRSAAKGFADEERKMRRAIEQEGVRVAGMAQHLLRKRLSISLDLIFSYSSMAPDLDFGAILTTGDRIAHATRRQWIGLDLGESPLSGAKPLADRARERMEAKVEREKSGTPGLIAAFPFWSKPDTNSKGVVVLRYSLARTQALVWHETLHESISHGLSLAAGCLLFWLLMSQRSDMGRLYRVLEHARSLVDQAEKAGPMQAADSPDELESFVRSFSSAAEHFNETEQQFNRLAEGIRDVFWYVRLDRGRRPFVNAAYLTIWEKESARELETRRWDWLRAVIAEDRRKALEWLRELQNRGQADPIELRLRFCDRPSIKWIECRGFALVGKRGIKAMGGLVADVTEQKELDRRFLEIAEEERRRIGQDLHDDVCQRMAAAQLKGGILQASLTRSGRPEAKLAAEVSRDLAKATDVVRGYVQGLTPVVIEAEGLAAALEQLAENVTVAFDVPCISSCATLPADLPRPAITHLFRIAQELATNAARHAQPSEIQITVSLSPDSGSLSLQVANDGLPFDGRPAAKTSGLGLHALRKHAEALGSRVVFSASKIPMGGTIATCDVTLPLN